MTKPEFKEIISKALNEVESNKYGLQGVCDALYDANLNSRVMRDYYTEYMSPLSITLCYWNGDLIHSNMNKRIDSLLIFEQFTLDSKEYLKW